MFNSSTDAEKAPERIQTYHGINTQHIRTRGNFLNLIKGTSGKHAANIILSERSLKSFPSRHSQSTLCGRFQPGQSGKRNKIKDIQNGKEKVTLSLLIDYRSLPTKYSMIQDRNTKSRGAWLAQLAESNCCEFETHAGYSEYIKNKKYIKN